MAGPPEVDCAGVLIVLSGLPGTGKTTIARELARVIGAVHLRIDSVEQALRDEGMRVEGEGYAVAYAVTADNLRVGRTVVADAVNPWTSTRDAWRDVARRAKVATCEVEVVCSDAGEHRRRVESRSPDISGHRLPSWQEVLERDYHAWDRDRLVLDTAHLSLDQCLAAIRAALDS